jgi:hypothetical protein
LKKLLALTIICLAMLALPLIMTSPMGARAVAATGPCGTLPLSSTSHSHVIWVWMENQSYSSIIGSPQAPYINSLATSCGLATNYHNITHPSLPNYIGATSGLPLAGLLPFVTDCSPSATCSTAAQSIFSQADSWKAYQESMPSNCAKANSGQYAVRHNPPPYYTTLSGCSTFDVPYTQLASDLTNDTLPAFSFVTPNLVNDMHDGTIAQGDAWLAQNLPQIFNSKAYQDGEVALFLTWDEGQGYTSLDCRTNTTDESCHVATIVVSPSTTPGTISSTLFNHYSMLRTTEELLNKPYLGEAAGAASMRSAFNL